MALVTLGKKNKAEAPPRFLDMGFRPFFAAAAIFAPLTVFIWIFTYSGYFQGLSISLSPFAWHAHEMIYGYAMAVIAGFLLTAVPSWTSQPYFNDRKLLLLVSFWIFARVSFFFSETGILFAAAFDIAFHLTLIFAVLTPVIRSKEWQYMAVLGKLLFLFVGNILFYLGATAVFIPGIQIGNYLGLYVVIGLILTMSRKLIPTYVAGSAEDGSNIRNSRLIDVSSLVLYIVFLVFAVFFPGKNIHLWLALTLFLLHVPRLILWYDHSIWKRPLIWSIYLSYLFFPLGFLLLFLAGLDISSQLLAVHAFSFGGIGLVTLSMICRVSLGHGGGNVLRPPAGSGYLFAALIIGAVLRVIFPHFLPGYYVELLFMSAFLWAAAFILFLIIYRSFLFPSRMKG